ncbi:Osmosensitive K+ channel histidine kinase KdpD [Alkalibacterium sp. AK22]|uniref:sensor histidine kinase n=1 Tax=Alkalibacterium sp. AK22 TaxID=1229520 RepID=UPI000449822E|nr:sensor histidine kinase KdpD [Alkalibacterium sp. AK22]EXJ24347.1 Osmosensitive K+ channel histidine kinase KdpD [Alkalibacterium sp. AK22]
MRKESDNMHVYSDIRSRSSSGGGQLKIYLGYAAGVGKTYAMLKDAQDLIKEGVDIVAGYVEPHDRPETSALLEGLEHIPPLAVPYKTMTVKEFDLDAALQRKPQVILVDEFAHTNVSGVRHAKRYQDIQELLRAGIDVYTTVNIQHIESLNDQIAAITGVSVRERIPDKIFDLAQQIEVVDIEPKDLLDRLNKGRIYKENQVPKALKNFFTLEKLIALREIALRHAADHVNRIALDNIELARKYNTATSEHILVCLSASPSNTKVIRTASRMAKAFNAKFTALYVESTNDQYQDSKKEASLRAAMHLADQLGAEIVTVYGNDIVRQIFEYARASRVTKIVVGRSVQSKRWPRKRSIVDKLSDNEVDIDIHVIPDSQSTPQTEKKNILSRIQFSLSETFLTLFILTITTLIGTLFDNLNFSEANIITVYILGVLLIAMLSRQRSTSLLSSGLAVLAFNFFFTEPRFTFVVYDLGYITTFIIMLAAGLVTSTLTQQVQMQAEESSRKAYYTEILFQTSKKLQSASTRQEIIDRTAEQITKLLDLPLIIYPSSNGALLEPLTYDTPRKATDWPTLLSPNELAVARWAFTNNQQAGSNTQTLSSSQGSYLVIRGAQGPLGVLGIVADESKKLQKFEKNLLIAILDECSLAWEKNDSNELQKELHAQIQKEKLRSNLLRAISHDLRVPLTSISGNSTLLINNHKQLDEEKQLALYSNIYTDSIWLINLVENLLSLTKLENGSLKLNLEAELIEEVIAEALDHADPNLANYKVNVSIDSDFLMLLMDTQLIVQVIVNIVNNAVHYTPAGSSISISVKNEGRTARIEIADNGPGIPKKDKERIFDMFYTSDSNSADGRRGMGLGLFLCKSILEAHGSSIYINNNYPNGTIIGFTLEVLEVSTHE